MRHIFGCFLRYLTCIIAASALLMQANAAKPSLKGTDLVCNGESFFAMTEIRNELSKLAQADGVLAANEKFGQVAVSGQPIATIISQFKGCNPKPKYIVSDGGGIDLMGNNCQAGDENCSKILELKKTLLDYIAEMKKSGVKSFLWMGYPEVPGNQALTTGQAIWTKVTKKVIAATTEPKAIYVDLLPVFEGHYNDYFAAGDKLHPVLAGSKAIAKAFWDAMKADDYAFFDTVPPISVQHEKLGTNPAVQLAIQSLAARSGNVAVSLSVDQPSNIALHLTTVSGRNVLMAKQQTTVSGLQTVVFPVGTLARGLYFCEVKVGNLTSRSTLLFP